MLAVVAEHLTGRPVGGFVGVDIFFVISGFLITGILVREFEKTGGISFGHFYRRRVKRIVPAATVVLVVCVVLALLLFTRENASSTTWDAIAAFFFVSNWRFAITGTDYFAIGGLPSPIQHFWSLSVEEQFYFVWPWLMLAVLLVVTVRLRRSRHAALRVVRLFLVVIVVASFGYAVFQSVTDATAAYFSTFTRAWELGVGGLIALTSSWLGRIPAVLRTPLVWLGIAGMVASVGFISPALPFPGPWAALPVLSAAAVIIASIGAPAQHNYFLVNPVARYFGDISYSLYLWHFPVIVFLAVIMPQQDKVYFAVALVVSIALASAFYHALERPIHKSPWLNSYADRADRRDAWRTWWQRNRRSVLWGATAILTASVVVVGSVAYVTVNSSTQRAAVAAAVEAQAADDDAYAASSPSDRTARERIAAALRESLSVTAWPALTPSADTVLTDGKVTLPGCHPSDPSDPSTCSFGVATDPEIVVFGDSLGATLLPTVIGAYAADHHIRGLTRDACPMIPLDVTYPDSNSRDACEQHQAASIDYINSAHPATVLVIENYEWANRLASGAWGEELAAEWTAAGNKFVASIAESGARVVFVTPPSMGKSIADCAIAISLPADCVSTVDPNWHRLRDAEAQVGGAALVDTLHWFCTDAGFCPSFADGTPTKRDYVHPTEQYITRADIVEDFRSMLGAS